MSLYSGVPKPERGIDDASPRFDVRLHRDRAATRTLTAELLQARRRLSPAAVAGAGSDGVPKETGPLPRPAAGPPLVWSISWAPLRVDGDSGDRRRPGSNRAERRAASQSVIYALTAPTARASGEGIGAGATIGPVSRARDLDGDRLYVLTENGTPCLESVGWHGGVAAQHPHRLRRPSIPG
jgi:hypothetical protein